MTIGDAWGVQHFAPNFFDNRGTSLVIVHTDNGRNFLSKARLEGQQVSFEVLPRHNPCFITPSIPDSRRANFFKDLKNFPHLPIAVMQKYFDALPGIQSFLDSSVEQAKARGYSRTLAGRIRPVKEIPAIGAALDRALINSPVQGTAADIARRAMINFEAACPGKLFLQVHDSLVCECSQDEADEVSNILSEVMKSSGGEIASLEVQIKSGKSLSDV